MTVFNTGETSDELRARYNPEGSILRKAQMRMLDMLLYIDSVCKSQSITYRIDAGNVLGAIRHKGFIPWDDDVDIVLTRENYKKLCSYLKSHPHSQYVLQDFSTDFGYVGAWSVLRDTKSEYIQNRRTHNARKFRGLQIDIFFYENRVIPILYDLSMRITRRNEMWFVGRSMVIARFIYCIQHYILHPIFRIIGVFFGNDKIYYHGYGAVFHVHHSEEALFPENKLIFEGYVFPGPASPDLYLKEHYGKNYMQLPSQDKRDNHHADYLIWD